MVNRLDLDAKKLFTCRKCGGQVLRFSDGVSCLQCGASPIKEERHSYPYNDYVAIRTKRNTRYTIPAQDLY